MNWIKRLFGKKEEIKQCDIPVVTKRCFEVRFNGKLNGKFEYDRKVTIDIGHYYSNRNAHIELRKLGYTIDSKIFEWNVL